MSVHKKLMTARIKLQQTELKKSGHNKFSNYYYFELGDFLPAVQKIFAELNLCGVVSFSDTLASLTIIDCEDNSSLVINSPMSTAALKGCHEVQNLGAVQTYLRRYLWVTAMEIVEHDALDASDEAEVKKEVKAPPKPPAKIEGKEGAFRLKVTTDPDATVEQWVNIVTEATVIALDNAKNEADVMQIFKVNRNIFDRLKDDAPENYKDLMEAFKRTKEKFKVPA